jgi:hypothetical protein
MANNRGNTGPEGGVESRAPNNPQSGAVHHHFNLNPKRRRLGSKGIAILTAASLLVGVGGYRMMQDKGPAGPQPSADAVESVPKIFDSGGWLDRDSIAKDVLTKVQDPPTLEEFVADDIELIEAYGIATQTYHFKGSQTSYGRRRGKCSVGQGKART